MDELSKLLQNVNQALGWLTAVTVVVLAPFAIRAGWLLLFRQANQDLERLLKQRDEELARFRAERTQLETRVKVMTERLASADNKLTRQGAIIYGLMRYQRRLERVCIEAGRPLPAKDAVSDELHE